MKAKILTILYILLPIIISGFCWYNSYGLTGESWWLTWFAPIPVLVASYRLPARQAFAMTFFAYLAGRLSWWTYLISVIPLLPTLMITVISPVIFAVMVISARKIVLDLQKWYVIFAFPVLCSSIEFLFSELTRDGSAGSLAYTQANFLPLIQIASVTGILGITFIITLVPTAISVAWFYRKDQKIVLQTLAAMGIIIGAVFLYGYLTLNAKNEQHFMKAGVVAIDVKLYEEEGKITPVIESCTNLVSEMASKGVSVVLFPEKINVASRREDSVLVKALSDAALQFHVAIIASYVKIRGKVKLNAALVLSPEGKSLTDYSKVKLYEAETFYGFSPGREPGNFMLNGVPCGVAICKDMDFPTYIRSLNTDQADVMFVPAWDFVQDAWLHSRMAILRGVENGYSIVRCAMQGALTISDSRGRVLYEVSSQQGRPVSLVGMIPLEKRVTIFSRFGNWFGFLNLLAGILMIGFLGLKSFRK